MYVRKLTQQTRVETVQSEMFLLLSIAKDVLSGRVTSFIWKEGNWEPQTHANRLYH